MPRHISLVVSHGRLYSTPRHNSLTRTGNRRTIPFITTLGLAAVVLRNDPGVRVLLKDVSVGLPAPSAAAAVPLLASHKSPSLLLPPPSPVQPRNPSTPQSPHTPVSFTPDQINNLRTQIHAFKLLSCGVPIPESIQNVIRNPHHATPELERLISSSDPTARIVDSVIKVQKFTESTGVDYTPSIGPAESISTAGGTSPVKTALKVEDGDTDVSELPKGPFLEDQSNSSIYPYNAYVHPFLQITQRPQVTPYTVSTACRQSCPEGWTPTRSSPKGTVTLMRESNRG